MRGGGGGIQRQLGLWRGSSRGHREAISVSNTCFWDFCNAKILAKGFC